jgi:hypothetical protein
MPCSPNFASSYLLFGSLKEHVAAKRFATDVDVKQEATSWLQTRAVESVHKSSDSDASIFKTFDSDSSIFKTFDSDSSIFKTH